jgi:hypothetical protein
MVVHDDDIEVVSSTRTDVHRRTRWFCRILTVPSGFGPTTFIT